MRSHFRKNGCVLGICISLFFMSTPLFATCGQGYIGGSVEAAFSHIENSHPSIRYYDDLLTDFYPANQDNNTKTVLNINGGYEFFGQGYIPAIALGLGIYTNPTDYHYSGNVNEQASGDPAFLLYNYRYKIRSTRLMAEAKFSWQIKQFIPYVDIGLGTAWNRLSDYTETAATIENYVVYPPFQSSTRANFAYQAGFGVGYAFNFNPCHTGLKYERISLGYRYANAGNVSSGVRNADYPFRLNVGNLSTNSVYLAYTHLF